MTVFYKRFIFWAYILAIFSNVMTLVADSFQVTHIRSWLSLIIIVMFIYFAYGEIKSHPLKKK